MKKQDKKILGLNLFNNISPEQRKLYIFAPTVIVITACVLYFGLFSETSAMPQNNKGEMDLILPDAKTKELSDEKPEVFDDLKEYNDGLEQEKNNDFDVILEDPLGAEPTNQQKQQQLMTVEEQIKVIEQKQQPIYAGTYNNNNKESRPLTKQEKEAKYREDLLKAREARLARSQDYSVPQEKTSINSTATNSGLEFKATVHRDQFILPGDRVTLILDAPLTYKRNTFKKNTFIYANANIQGSRVMLSVTNIDHIPISLVAKDMEDGNLGLHSDRAGELWRQFQTESQSNGVNEVGNDIAQNVDVPLVGNTIRAFTQFFRRNKFKERDKILLVDDTQLIVTTEK